MRILGIDPGTTQSGWAILEDGKIACSGVMDNWEFLSHVFGYTDLVAIEVFEPRGMPIGKDSVETILFTGMLLLSFDLCGDRPKRVSRRDVKLHLCGSAKAKDANIRQVLIDKYGAPGTKKNPGGTYGVTSHAWAALAVADYASVYNDA